MWIFKDIVDRYCQKILDSYQKKADTKKIMGKEALLLISRNECARELVGAIKKIEVQDKSDFSTYFEKVLAEIGAGLRQVKEAVEKYNTENDTEFTTDLYETFFTPSLISFINIMFELFRKSPLHITELMDETKFANNRNVPWVYQFSSVLFDYVLENEFDLIVKQGSRDIFDDKKKLVFKSIQSAAVLHSKYNDENNTSFQDEMKTLLQNMGSDEHNLQQRKQSASNSSMLNLFTATLYIAVGKGKLGHLIETLSNEFNERTMTKQPSSSNFLCS